MHMYPSLTQIARFSPHREYEFVRLLAGTRWDGPSFKAALAHSAALDGPWRSVSVCSKRQNYRAACAANAQNGRVVNPNSLVSVASGAGFMFFCLRHIESVACKRFQSTLRASERFRFAGNHTFFAIARYANSRKTKFSTANTVRYTGIIPMPTYCWIKPKAVGIKVLPM